MVTLGDLRKISIIDMRLHRNAVCLLTALECLCCEPRLLAMSDCAQVNGAGG